MHNDVDLSSSLSLQGVVQNMIWIYAPGSKPSFRLSRGSNTKSHLHPAFCHIDGQHGSPPAYRRHHRHHVVSEIRCHTACGRGCPCKNAAALRLQTGPSSESAAGTTGRAAHMHMPDNPPAAMTAADSVRIARGLSCCGRPPASGENLPGVCLRSVCVTRNRL